MAAQSGLAGNQIALERAVELRKPVVVTPSGLTGLTQVLDSLRLDFGDTLTAVGCRKVMTGKLVVIVLDLYMVDFSGMIQR